MNASSIPPRFAKGRAGEVKGVALRNFPDILASLHGEDARARLLASLSAEVRDALANRGIVASGWYPLAWYREMHRAARIATGNELGLARRIGRESTKRDLGGVYSVFLRVLSPGFVLSTCSRFFGVYYRPGTMKLVESRKGYGRVTFAQCHGFNEDVWQDVFGGCEVTMELAGAKTLRVRLEKGGHDGDVDATLIAWWAGEANASLPDDTSS